MSYHKLREWLSEQEHIQWEFWSKEISKELQEIKVLCYAGKTKEAIQKINYRLNRWEKFWKPYNKLTQEIKEYDRVWADKILDNVPFKCPIYQCGGIMQTKERKAPKDYNGGENYPDGYHGDEQTPNLVCSNCKGVYEFKSFVSETKKKNGTTRNNANINKKSK